MNSKTSFEERIASMRQAAHDLKGIADFLIEEVIRMEAAQQRFAASKATRPPKQTATR